jgi:Na+/proline symporter
MTPLELNLFIAVAVIIFFLIQGLTAFKRKQTEDSYFLVNRNLTTSEFSYSFAAASTSLATVLFFFTVLGLDFGLYIFYAPLTYVIGVWVFNKVLLPKLSQQGYFDNTKQITATTFGAIGTTLGNYILHRLNSKLLKYTVIILTLIGMMSILLIELYVGVNIFAVYFKPEFSHIALIVLTIVVFLYTGFGGFEAVVKTDKYQFKLILFATLSFLAWLVYKLFDDGIGLKSADFFGISLPISKGIALPYPLIFNMLAVNVLLIPSMLRTWQMASATGNAETVKKGNIQGVKMTFLLTAAFVLIGILFFKYIFPINTGETPASLIMIFNKLNASSDFIGSYIILPIFFSACLAALLSTADSALMPIMQSLVQDFGTVKPNRAFPLRKLVIVSLLLFSVTLGLYFIVFKVLNFDLINWLYTIFSFLIICSPLVFFAVLAPERLLQKKFTNHMLFIVLIIGFAIAIGLSIYGNSVKNQAITMLNSPISCGFISVIYLTYYFIHKNRK